jgi:hypothetical protein
MLAPVPSMELESEIARFGNPDSGKKQHALGVLMGGFEPDTAMGMMPVIEVKPFWQIGGTFIFSPDANAAGR